MSRRRHPRALSFLATGGLSLLVTLVIVGGCASESEDGDLGASSTSSSGSSVVGSSSGATSSGASGSGGTSSGTTSSGGFDSSVPDVSFSYDAPYAKDGDACAETKGVATKKQVDMFVMLDRSGSMNYPCGTANCESGNPPKGDCNIGDTKASKWCNTINALSKYFKSAQATGNAASMQTFLPPSLTGLTVQQLCSASGTTSSNDLSSSSIPGAATGYVTLPSTSFDTFLNNTIPEGQTPTLAAARGIVKFTGRAANQRAGRITIGVLVTDGDPTQTICNENTTIDQEVDDVAAVLQQHYAATGIPTFVIGMNGATFANVEKMAVGGSAPTHPDAVGTISDACGNGAGPCRHFNIGDGNNEALAEALNLIQGFAVACKYNIPKPLVGAINYKDVKVLYNTTELTKVNDAGSCVGDGWYYDNNLSPTTINLCPAQCSTAQANPTATINVSFGCLGG
jgi:hypothetical protein